MTAALDARGISVSFGGVRACDGIDLVVEAGETVGLTGPNGSGKSTFLNALVGLVDATGSLSVAGVEAELGHPGAVRQLGVARTFQSPQNWHELSVLENVLVGSADRAATGLWGSLVARPTMMRHERIRWQRAQEILDRLGLGGLAGSPASLLTYGQQRMLELARSVASEPRILLIDEPAAGLNATETEFLGEYLRELRASNVSILVIDHKIDFLDSLSDRIVVLQLGSVIAEGLPGEIWKQEGVIDAYLGADRD